MVEHAADYEWRGEGDAGEVVLYAAAERAALSAFEHLLPAARLPGVESPVYGAASPEGIGWVAVSGTHVAPDLVSVPTRGLLLAADAALDDLGVQPGEIERLIPHRLSEARRPRLTAAGIRGLCEAGAYGAAEDGLIEEEDLHLLGPLPGDADAIGGRAISAGSRDWDLLEEARAHAVGEVLDDRALEGLGLERGTFALVVTAGAGELGGLALSGHGERIATRSRGGDFGAGDDLPAAPAESEEAADLMAALGAAANFADGRAALLVYALRLELGGVAGDLSLRAAWRIGGIEDRDGFLAHRMNLAAAGEGEVLASGGSVVAGTGKMSGSVPPFGVPEDSLPWEEAGLLERWAGLDPPEGKS